MNRPGFPIGLFTTNRWIIADNWCTADDVIKMPDCFDKDISWPPWPANIWLIVAADRVGREVGQPFIGQSLIVGYTSWPLAGPARAKDAEIIHADANLSDARRSRNWNEYNQVLRHRRGGHYDEMLGTGTKPRCYWRPGPPHSEQPSYRKKGAAAHWKRRPDFAFRAGYMDFHLAPCSKACAAR